MALLAANSVMLSGEQVCEANSFGVEASLPTDALREVGISRFGRSDNPEYSEWPSPSRLAALGGVDECVRPYIPRNNAVSATVRS